ncbi:MAG: hypothetical protein QM586_12210 [Xenophilus sp.]
MKKSILHAVTGASAMLIIATFWTSTIVSELFMGHAAVVSIKHAIVYFGLAPLVILMASTGALGNLVGRGRKGRWVEGKKKRMLLITLNGLAIIIPCALFLNDKAASGQFDTLFYAIQVIELIAGAAQLTLLGLNFRDGLKLAGRLHSARGTCG